jgi:phosphinothricin acetyltransferase
MNEKTPLPGAVVLRDVRDADMEAIAAIYAHHVLNGFGSLAEMEARRQAGLARGMPWLVAETDSGIAGYAYAGPFRLRAAYRYALEDSVYVAPEFKRRGVGRTLLAGLLERCEAGPWRQMLAVIGDSGNHGSVGLHRALGFAPVGVFTGVGFKFGRWVDVVLMQRPLGPGAGEPPPR